jgi:nucleotide-binding universal stress UspA family protein
MVFERLLVPVDFGPASERAADIAVAIADKLGATVELVHSFHVPTIAYGEGIATYVPYDDLRRDAEKALEAERARVAARAPSIQAALVEGDPRDRIADLATERGADLIVMGTHGRRGLSRVVFGSVAERIVRTSPVPVLTVGSGPAANGGAGFRHVLAPTDFGEPAERGVAAAAALASAFGAKLTIVHACAMPATIYDERTWWPTAEILSKAETSLERAVTKTRAIFPTVKSALVRGDPRDGVLEAVRERGADLVVVGTHARRGLSRVFLGSVAESIVRTSPVPVLTIGAPSKAKIGSM